MMSLKGALPLLVVLTVTGCTSGSQRTEAPAPIYEKGERLGEARNPAGSTTVMTAPLGGPEVTVGGGQFDSAAPMPETSRHAAGGPAAAPSTSLAYAPRTSAPPVTAAQPMSSAARSLVDQAYARTQEGDLTGAASLLERAVRLEPRHPLPWNRLAHIRFDMGSHALASELAEKSNALAGADASLKRDNWQLIAESRRRAGDATGAREAEQKAEQLR